MAVGLRVYNSLGNLILDIGSRPVKLLSVDSVTVGVPGSVSYSGTTGNVVAIAPETSSKPTVSIAAGTASYTWPDGGTGATKLLLMEF